MNNTEGNKLSDKIREVFDNYEDNGAAEGWEQLRRKYPARDSRPVYLWISSIAAVLLLSTAVWFWTMGIPGNETANTNALVKKDSALINDKAADELNNKPLEESSSLEGSLANNSQSTGDDIEEIETIITDPKLNSLARDHNSGDENTLPGSLNERRSKRSSQTNNVLSSRVSEIDSTQLLARNDVIELNNSLPEHPKESVNFEFDARNAEIANYNLRDSISGRAASTMPTLDDRLAGLGQSLGNTELPVQTARESSHALSVYGGSFINFAAGSESDLNFAAGLSSDLKISSRLKLSTGLSLARNSLSFENGVPEKARMNDALSFNSPSSVPNGSLVSLNNYTAELINLDIPINLKYQLGHGKNDFFVSAGVSSGTFVSERYVSDFSTYNLNSGAYFGHTVSTNKISKEFAEFDFARTLNFSFGFTTGFGKKQNLTFEPFLKYPLRGLGTQDILFGSSGINVKLNLSKND